MIERWEQKEIDYQAGEAYVCTIKAWGDTTGWSIKECREYDGIIFGCDQSLAYWDTINREAITWCTVCERVFHRGDLAPCGPADAACPDCRAAWAIMMQDDESEGVDVS